jgi:hypothetical protein
MGRLSTTLPRFLPLVPVAITSLEGLEPLAAAASLPPSAHWNGTRGLE